MFKLTIILFLLIFISPLYAPRNRINNSLKKLIKLKNNKLTKNSEIISQVDNEEENELENTQHETNEISSDFSSLSIASSSNSLTSFPIFGQQINTSLNYHQINNNLLNNYYPQNRGNRNFSTNTFQEGNQEFFKNKKKYLLKPLIETQSKYLSDASIKALSIFNQLNECYKFNENEQFMLSQLNYNKKKLKNYERENYNKVIFTCSHLFWSQQEQLIKLLNIPVKKVKTNEYDLETNKRNEKEFIETINEVVPQLLAQEWGLTIDTINLLNNKNYFLHEKNFKNFLLDGGADRLIFEIKIFRINFIKNIQKQFNNLNNCFIYFSTYWNENDKSKKNRNN
ncbi:hypothetical protein Mgra_00005555 [Meloidogyne graminicola]|uniref:Uncharacterized protein n=1 Tax=Meloidogyne graminicola TaxID=189291 RepID=A0A8S9ZPE7_9BILA|nr:hypothetical protein Mgra_00005555 [Meloidogyne graminicola]